MYRYPTVAYSPHAAMCVIRLSLNFSSEGICPLYFQGGTQADIIISIINRYLDVNGEKLHFSI